MQLSKKFLQPVWVFKPTFSKDDEGNQVTSWSVTAILQAIVQPVNSKFDVSQYGTDLSQVKQILEDVHFFREDTHEGWGISITGRSKPSHTVLSIDKYPDYTKVLIKRM
ncbi:hypothetical protein [Pseudolactococcus reticulitermitis]|uniref:Uncharacterized protein n=1 Tax=Pseudolactococcus reticulitermitis TaxID=2025039 RepID=A0A224X5F7_9LACT|nr:hypothetical protein [Lactococcus reticulitermitis]GAX46770.1 hypothetical protein RsY01_349 [Lactococcus reticulitermitis]